MHVDEGIEREGVSTGTTSVDENAIVVVLDDGSYEIVYSRRLARRHARKRAARAAAKKKPALARRFDLKQ